MAKKDLIIDDEYCKIMGTYFAKQGEQIDKLSADYVAILQEVKNKAIVSGDVSKALGAYITYARKLNKQVGSISTVAKKQVDNFLSKVDAADQYLF